MSWRVNAQYAKENAMPNLLDETVISLSQAAREVPSLRQGKQTNPATIWRWAKYGVQHAKGCVKLETVTFAGRTATTREAVKRFLARCANNSNLSEETVQPAIEMPSRSRERINAAAILDAAGI